MQKWSTLRPEYDFPKYKDKPSIYLLASTPRSGSHYLAHLLISTQLLGAPLEYFHHHEIIEWKKYFHCDDLCDLFRKLFSMRSSSNGWFGIKSHWSQYEGILKNQNLGSLLGIKQYIYIERNDLLAQAISLEIALQSNYWISFQNKISEPEYRFDRIYKRLCDLRTEKRKWDLFFMKNKILPIRVIYEDLLLEPNLIVQTIFHKFNISYTQMNFGFDHMPQRQNSAINIQWREKFITDAKKDPAINQIIF